MLQFQLSDYCAVFGGRFRAIGCVAPADKLNGHEQKIFKERDRKLEAPRDLRKQKRQQARPGFNTAGEAHLPLTHVV